MQADRTHRAQLIEALMPLDGLAKLEPGMGSVGDQVTDEQVIAMGQDHVRGAAAKASSVPAAEISSASGRGSTVG